jgi:uncharacterized protein (DUF1778 family)
MSTRDEHDKRRLAIEIEPELRKRIETAAALQGVSMRDYVVAALREALDSNGSERPSSLTADWSQLSTRSFARDWESDVDAIYDDLA